MVEIDGIKWDFGPDDEITYFDVNKSYYITHYRPINKEQGLDFDPDWFRKSAKCKMSTGKFSPHRQGTKTHRDFWKAELRKSEEGFTSNGYRVTGDNYFWLNFYRLKQTEEGAKAGSGRKVAFPFFLVYQYEYFHYVEICEKLGYDVGLLKSRGIGFSEVGASLCARPYITTPNYRVAATAFSKNHIGPLLAKIWAQLNWLNIESETAFKRVRMVADTILHKRASKRNKDGEECGHMSEVEGIIADKASKIRGDRCERLFYEEIGSDPIFKRKWIQGEALVTTLDDKMGTRIGWGTGGDEGVAIDGIKDMTNNPDSFNVLPFRHNHTQDGRELETAMFIPAYVTVRKLMDKRGWCDPDIGKAHYKKAREKKASDPEGLLMYKAEYCFTIDEALSMGGSNMFPREELAEQLTQIEIYKTTPTPQTGHLVFTRDDDDQPTGVKWRKGANKLDGKIHILEHPLKNEEGCGYNNLYVAGIDSIDIGQKDSATQDAKKLSDFCIVIKKRNHGLSDPQYVAIYKDRPRDIREAYDNAAKMLMYYNCKAVLESTRTALLTHFRNKKLTHLLMKRPRATLSDIKKGNSKMYGAPASQKIIAHYRELIYDHILDYSHGMYFIEMVQQCLSYSDERKKDFDIIAAMGYCELGDEEMSSKTPEAQEPVGKVHRDIGWWKDDKGYKHYGIIPLNEEERYERTRVGTSDSWLYNDSV